MIKKACFIIFILLLFSSPFLPHLEASSNYSQKEDAVAVLGDIHIHSQEEVKGNVVVILGKGVIEGPVRGDVINILGEVSISERVEGDLISVIGESNLLDNTLIDGRLVNILSDINRGDETQIKGGETKVLPQSSFNLSISREWYQIPGIPFLRGPSLHFSNVIVSGILALLVLILIPGHVKKVRENIQLSPGKSALWGFIGYLVAFPVIIFFTFTIIGIPIAVLLGMLLLALRFLGYVALVLLVGDTCLKMLNNSLPINKYSLTATTLLSVVAGIVIISFISAIPVIGFIISLGISLVALGGVISLVPGAI